MTDYDTTDYDTPDQPELTCVICGRPLGYNIDDQPDWPTGPMCGDCYQSRELDNDIAAEELNDANADDDGW